ncbi:NUDIX hydrolase [Nesterenkonia alkaliphila]|uniref:NUDIX domain-containing protein n=1 Tax=Nesterenkonia alkaliphila TaxID=1463631 RepID=A0A7K1UK32_9MICC|nr:NUDIX domain-containing protein [Nesterenkonia alkaliphila]MVT26682.1 NUDIX domain-containing protein [Nesterenkonia alkaliphila]
MKKQFTATGYVVNLDRTRMLMIFHQGLQRWLPPGGHVDPDEFPSDTALREVFEETGIHVRHSGHNPLEMGLNGTTESQLPTPFAMAAQLIPESHKDIEHIHMDMMYLLEADDTAPLTAQEQEVDDVGWFTRYQLEQLTTTDSVRAFAREHLLDL